MTRTVALLTDFGTTDTYVGVMKGVMLGICPDLQFVDLTHAIQPQNVKQAAFALLNSYRFFPPDTIFLVVVDPGVGSERRAIAARAGGYTFVAPDNGVLSYLLRELGHVASVELNNLQQSLAKVGYRRERISSTFHGRDIFAPAAALLATVVPLDQLGNRLEQPVELPAPLLITTDEQVRGEVLHIDHFGSLVTSVGILRWADPKRLLLHPCFGAENELSIAAEHVVVTVGTQSVTGIRHTYAEVSPGEPLALVGSSGYLELAVNSGSFRSLTAAAVGDPVVLRFE